MTFERSTLGQSNRRLFLGVDLIVYVEGGRDDDDAFLGFDQLFWRQAISAVRPDLTVRMIPKGSKQNVLDIFSSWRGGSPPGVYCAIDSDYDVLTGNIRRHPQLLHTFGYSYENDLAGEDIISDTFHSLCPVDPSTSGASESILEAIAAFERVAKRLARADAAAVSAGYAVIDRRKPQRYITAHDSAIVQLRIDQVREALRVANVRPRPRCEAPYYKAIVGVHNMVGHVVFEFMYRLYMKLCGSRCSHSRAGRDPFRVTLIMSFCASLARGKASPIFSHYSQMLRTI